ncbi:unnamed protein product [Paramecium pentaurelia]|uniref:G domain-containing protein n=1 Tax=Paramecium pentaurelia TaxID=43138 RepID=A0A8S1XU55_9CILI|nr:unnamed protein product [Paramecium pentaurelia]
MLQNENSRQVVLIGYIGHGKTTLFNKICQKKQPVQFGGPSVTRESVLSQSAYGEGFNLIDTPGLGTDKDKLAHVICIATALTFGLIHQILIVVQLERLATMKERLRPMIQQQFKRFKDIITVVVTHWDKAEEPEKRKQELIDLIKGYNVKSMIFVSKETSGKDLCQMIDVTLQNCDQQGKISEIQSHFDIIDLTDDVIDQLNNAKGQVSVKFDKTAKAIKGFIKNFSDTDPTMPEVMHQLTLAIKDYADETILKFQKDNMDLFNDLYSRLEDDKLVYLIDAQLKQELIIQVNGLVSLAQEKMKISKQQCFNYIKQCPYCGEIWMKVYGCNEETFCGKLPENEDQHFKQSKIPRRFQFQFQESGVIYNDLQIQFSEVDKSDLLYNQLEFFRSNNQDRQREQFFEMQRQSIYNPLENAHPFEILKGLISNRSEQIQPRPIQQRNMQPRLIPPRHIPSVLKNNFQFIYQDHSIFERKGKIGCGKSFIWRELKPLSQEQLKELLDPGVLDYLANVVNEEKQAKQIELATKIESLMKTSKVVILE